MNDELPPKNLRKLNYSPELNPLLEPSMVPIKTRKVRSGLAESPLANMEGDIVATSVIHRLEKVDTEHFVKIFAAGIKATYELSAAATKTFTAVLAVYEREHMSNGYADSVHLAWFDNKLSGQSVNISNQIFNRGMRELLQKQFLAPRMPNLYWVNPALFFKGDRVLFANEYRRADTRPDQNKNTITISTGTIETIETNF